MRVPNPSPALDKNRAPMGPEILSSTAAGIRRKAPKGLPDSSSVLDQIKISVCEERQIPSPAITFSLVMVSVRISVAFHLLPQITSYFGCNVIRKSNPHRNR